MHQKPGVHPFLALLRSDQLLVHSHPRAGTREEPVWVRFHIFLIVARSEERKTKTKERQSLRERKSAWERRKDETPRR